MPLVSYEGNTFVAFIDISGFKELMRNENEAWRALDRLYNTGYLILGVHSYETNKVNGLFVSDSGVLFVRRENQRSLSTIESLRALLLVVKGINERMIDVDFMLTTSIAYGRFKYQERNEFEGIEKNPIYGDAYLTAYKDTEYGKPKIQPGQCRIVKKNLPKIIKQSIKDDYPDEIFRMIKERNSDKEHFYFYWMIDSPNDIYDFECRYTNAFKLTYDGILKALKGD